MARLISLPSSKMELCKPASAILLVATAGSLYHLIVGELYNVLWWLIVGFLGTGVFQILCTGGLEPVAWVLMMIPVLIVCFFLAIALLASSLRINNVRTGKCNVEKPCKKPRPSCKKPKPCGCNHCHKGRDSDYVP